MTAMTRHVHGADGLAGPLLFLRAGSRVAIGEWVDIALPGQPARRGQVIEASADATVVQVLEETLGIAPGLARITLTGDVARAVVGRELLGRVFSGLGAPLDELPPPIGEDVRPPTSSRPASPRSMA
jgi:V/A-type H+-transporting ATPase subunit B